VNSSPKNRFTTSDPEVNWSIVAADAIDGIAAGTTSPKPDSFFILQVAFSIISQRNLERSDRL
jgi:hypothetical protein